MNKYCSILHALILRRSCGDEVNTKRSPFKNNYQSKLQLHNLKRIHSITFLHCDLFQKMPAAVAGPSRFRHENPLEKDILATGPLRTKTKKRKAKQDEDDEEAKFIDSRASRKILKIGQELQDEDQAARPLPPSKDPFAFQSRFPEEDQEEEDLEKYEHDDEAWGDEEDEEVEEVVRESLCIKEPHC